LASASAGTVGAPNPLDAPVTRMTFGLMAIPFFDL
jgi:hypothetical protein